jgi:hypothetical protein
MCEKLRATRQCSSIKDIFAPIHSQALTRWADDWVVTCRTRAEAQSALAQATKILEKLGVTLNREKSRIVHIAGLRVSRI